MNNVILVGRTTKAPDVRVTNNGLTVARFSVAIDRGKDKDGNDKGADFPNVVVFGRQAENCEKYLKKGLKVAVQGHIQTGSYEKDGKKVYTTDVVADRVEFLEWGEKPQQEGIPEGFSAVNDEDIPF